LCNTPEALSGLTEKQALYLYAMLDFIEQHQVPTILRCCAAIGIERTTAWRWHQDEKFLTAKAKVLGGMVTARHAEVDYSIQQSAMRGNPKAQEMYLRMTGRWNDADPLGGMVQQGTATGVSAPGGIAMGPVSSVTFVGLPAPPTPQQVAARNPPSGSNVVIEAQLAPAGK
jgi:hypothetical protein